MHSADVYISSVTTEWLYYLFKERELDFLAHFTKFPYSPSLHKVSIQLK